MDPTLAHRLENDEDFQKLIAKLARDYVDLGLRSLNYWIDEFDAAHDILMCYAPLSRADLENMERGHPRRFILPMTATQISTMTTFIAQSLFGEDCPHKVEGRGPEDEVPAEHVNQLLRWNAEQQPTYLLGYLWIQDILTFNRGIFYNSWAPIYKSKVNEVDAIPDEFEIDPATNKPRTVPRLKRVRVPAGGFCKYHLVSPYDFFCDPATPLWRMQEGRFAGHRTIVPWQELKRRSLLPPDHPAYLLPSAVTSLNDRKKQKRKSVVSITAQPSSSATGRPMSRTAFERNRSTPVNVQETANADDPGMIEVTEVWVRMVPADNEISNDEEPCIYQFIIANGETVLAINESTYEHDQYPYNVAEGRPSAYYPFSPSMVIMLKSLQDYIDYLKNRHQEAIMRTVGNIFIARADKVNLTDFLNPDKEGLIIPILPEAGADKIDDIIKQVQVNDLTKDFPKEVESLISFSESVSGVSSQMQGQVEGKGTATEFAGTQQMGAGRLTSLARLISVEGLVPQTKQIVANFQQFMDTNMVVRFHPNLAMPPQFSGITALTITRDIIQGEFDFIAHDGTLPGADSKKVAAMSRALEAAAEFPMFFTPQPGNLDARAMLLALLKAAGVNVENFQFTAQSLGGPGAPGTSPGPALPDLNSLPPSIPLPSGPGPGRPELPSVDSVPSASPPQVRPQNL